MSFETPTIDLAGKIKAAVHDEVGIRPSNIIKVGDKWSVHVRWQMKDRDGGDDWRKVAGHWHVHVNLESIGPGPEISLYEHTDSECHWQKLPSANGKYKCHFDVPGNLILNEWKKEMGNKEFPHQGLAMKLLVLLSYYLPTPDGAPRERGDIAAFYEGPIVQFFKPE